MQGKNEEAAEERIRAAKQAIMELGPMRPGLLTVQYRDRAHRRGAYRQLSYTFRRRSRSEHVRDDELARIEEELRNYAAFKALCAELVAASLELSQLRTAASRRKGAHPPAD